MQVYSGIALRVDLSKQGGPYSSCPSIAATYQQFCQLIAVTLSCVSLHRAWTGGLQQADCTVARTVAGDIGLGFLTSI
jgi:hypothetical protein